MLTPSGRPEAPRTLHFTSVSYRGGVWDHPLLTPLGGPRRSGPCNLPVILTAGGGLTTPCRLPLGSPRASGPCILRVIPTARGAGNHPLPAPSGRPDGLRTLYFTSDSYRRECQPPPSVEPLWEARGPPDPVFYERFPPQGVP